MDERAVRWTWADDGVVDVVLDDPGRRVNTVSRRHHDGMAALLEELDERHEQLRGVVVSSAKTSFFTGEEVGPADMSAEDMAAAYELSTPVKDQLRRLETLGRPVAAALTGSALGFGLEIGLACHWRVGLDAPGVVYGSPEVTMGILPGGGGLVRLTRLLGVQRGFEQVFGSGRQQSAREALAWGVLDEVRPDRAAQLAAARAWVLQQPAGAAVQRWERVGYCVPGGVEGDPRLEVILPEMRARVSATSANTAQTAATTVLETAVESTGLPLEDAFALESARQQQLLASPVTPVLGAFVFGTVRALRDGARRPAGPQTAVRRIAVTGASRLASALRARAVDRGLEVTTDAAGAGVDLLLDADEPPGDATSAAATVLRAVEPGSLGPAPGMRVVVGSRPEEQVAEVHGGDEASRRMAFDVVRALGYVPVLSDGGGASVLETLQHAFCAEADALRGEGVSLRRVVAGAASVGFGPSPLGGGSTAPVSLVDDPQPVDARAGDRLLDAVARAAADLVAAGASSQEEVDVASRAAVGYPDWTGGAATRAKSTPRQSRS